MKRLDGKVVWVTGGGSGIGEAAAMTLAAEGAAVVLTGRREAPLNEVAAWIRDAGGVAHVQPGDLTDPAAVRRIGDYIKAEGMSGRIGSRLMAIVAEGDRGRLYLAPPQGMEAAALAAPAATKPVECPRRLPRTTVPALPEHHRR